MALFPKTKDISNYILFVLNKRRRMLAIVGLCVFVTILILTSLITPTWKATTKVLIKRSSTGETGIYNTGNKTAGSMAITSKDVLNMKILLSGESIARQIVGEFKLDERLKEKRTAPKNIRERVQNLFAGIFMSEKNWTDTAVNNLIEKQQVIKIENESNVIRIDILAESREVAVSVANRMAQLLKERSADFTRKSAGESYTLVRKQLKKAEKKVDRAKAGVAKYKINNSIISIEKEKILKMARVDALETELVDTDKEIEETLSRLAQVTQEIGKLDKKIILSSIIAKNPLVIELESTLENLEIDLASKLINKTKIHPEITMLTARINKIHSTLIDTVGKITKSQTESINPLYQNLLRRSIDLKIDNIALNAREKAINKALIVINDDIKSIPERESELAKLEDTLKTNALIYQVLNTKLSELTIKRRSSASEYGIVVLDKAYLSPNAGTTRPNWILTILAAIFYSVVLALASTFILEFFNDSIKSALKVTSLMNVPCLGVLPDLTKLQGIPEAVLVEDEL